MAFFSKPNRSIGLDIGTHSVKAVQMSKARGQYRVEHVGFAPIDAGQLSVDPVEAQAGAVREALRTMPMGNSLIVGALPGQTVVIRYPRLPEMPEEQLQRAVDREAAQNLPFELSEVYVDSTILERSVADGQAVVKVLLVAAKHELIDMSVRVAKAAEIQFAILGVDSLALADAAECCGFLRENESVALIDIGTTSTIVHFVKDGVSNYYRDANWGTREMIQAITRAQRCEPAEAERILREGVMRGASTGPQAPAAPPAEPSHGGPSDSEFGGGEDVASPFSSDLEDLGGSPLEPLDEELSSAPAPGGGEPGIGTSAGAEQTIEDILRTPLANLVGEIRRSFDFYEHQLGERPVERIILSGGASNLPMVRDTLQRDLGFSNIEVADPTASALLLGREEAITPMRRQPSQFIVALGLAARGAAEL